MGDLNYRIGDLSVDVVKVHIEKKDFQTLLEHDQVHMTVRVDLLQKALLLGREGVMRKTLEI